MNVFDEVPQLHSRQGNPKLDQIRYIVEMQNHEFVDSEVVRLLSKVYAFYEEERHVIMDCPFVPFHTRTCIARHVELQNVSRALMDKPQEHELGIPIVQNRLRGMELGSQLGPQN